MKILVCVKNIPDAQSERRIEEGRLVRGEDDILNDLDEFAIEAAVQIVDEVGGEVVAVTMGPENSDEALVRALQMGADRAVHVCDDRLAGTDAIGTARVLDAVRILEEESAAVDLIILGMASLDSMTSLVPPALSELWNQPLVSCADSLQLMDGEVLRIKRDFEGTQAELEVTLPAVISVTDQVNEPRYPSFKDIKAARSKTIDVLGLDELTAVAPDVVLHDGVDFRVLSARHTEAKENRQIIQDSGSGGIELAEYLFANAGGDF